MAEFDINRFVSHSRAVDLTGIDWVEARRVSITDEEHQILRYMQDTESHTILYMRDLLTVYTAADPEVTTFLACWVYEEMHHGRALDRFLVEVGRPSAEERHRQVHARRSSRERTLDWLGRAVGQATPHFAAVHMSWGAVNEYLAAMSYTQLARRTANRPLQQLVSRLAKDERRHYSFYYHQAERRLRAGGVLAQRLCALTLQRFWAPVGIGVGDPSTLDLVTSLFFDDRRGREEVAQFQQRIRELPGLGAWDAPTRWREAGCARFQAARPADFARHRAADALRDAADAAELASPSGRSPEDVPVRL